MTALTADTLTDLIRRSMPDAIVEAQDMRGDGAHFAVSVVSKAFDGLSRIEQHRKVYQALSGHVDDGSLHAIQIKTALPDAAA